MMMMNLMTTMKKMMRNLKLNKTWQIYKKSRVLTLNILSQIQDQSKVYIFILIHPLIIGNTSGQ
jgi:hypothetical protein